MYLEWCDSLELASNSSRPRTIDYVIAHELAHLIEMNHSPAFWATVARIYPHYDRARKQLKEIAVAGLPQI